MDTDAMFRLILGLEKRISIIETYLADSPRFVIPGESDELYQQAKKVVKKYEYASTALLQRRLQIGYATAANLIDQLEEQKVIGPANGAKPRKVLKNDVIAKTLKGR